MWCCCSSCFIKNYNCSLVLLKSSERLLQYVRIHPDECKSILKNYQEPPQDL